MVEPPVSKENDDSLDVDNQSDKPVDNSLPQSPPEEETEEVDDIDDSEVAKQQVKVGYRFQHFIDELKLLELPQSPQQCSVVSSVKFLTDFVALGQNNAENRRLIVAFRLHCPIS